MKQEARRHQYLLDSSRLTEIDKESLNPHRECLFSIIRHMADLLSPYQFLSASILYHIPSRVYKQKRFVGGRKKLRTGGL